MRFENDNGTLRFYHQGEQGLIEAWGQDSLRVRTRINSRFTGNNWALTEPPVQCDTQITITEEDHWVGDGTIDMRELATITNGRLKAIVNFAGVISFYKDDQLILREYFRSYDGTLSRESRCLKIINREWKGIIGGSEFSLNVKFESRREEKIFGMGQYQQDCMDLKGCVLELAQRNSQISVPFAVSSLGYGFLWNNPAVGRVTFGRNYYEWIANATKEMDYWITAADTPKQILYNYTAVTGRAGMFPDDLMGLWQCKLRYRTQDEVLTVARQYQKEGIHIDQIVIDFFHWTVQGDWKFDSKYWPDPKAMVDELHSMGIKVIVSVWPSVDRRSENFGPMLEKGLLIRTERGAAQTYDFQGDCVEVDAFNPEARKYVWEVCRKNYYDYGIDGFWLDNSEPDFGVYDYDHYRYCDGTALEIGNLYPQMFSRTFYDEMNREKDKSVAKLLRCAWAGSQKYGNVVWSGDVPSTFEAFADQLQCGLNMGLAGIPWWTTDIGGFHGGNPDDPKFRELFARWFAWGTFCPVMRLHGDREPRQPQYGTTGGATCCSGAANEVWSYGEEVYEICKKYMEYREQMRPYTRKLMEEAHEKGTPVMRTLFYMYPRDCVCWDVEDEYMYGPDVLVAPVLYAGQAKRSVYLPKGDDWVESFTGKEYAGGQTIEVDTPLAVIPVFVRKK